MHVMPNMPLSFFLYLFCFVLFWFVKQEKKQKKRSEKKRRKRQNNEKKEIRKLE